jgi:hypothetical protein
MPELMVDFITSRVLTGPPDPARADRGRGRDVRLASGPCRVACAPADVSAGRSATAFAVTLWPVEAFELSGEMSSYDGRGFCRPTPATRSSRSGSEVSTRRRSS